MNKQGGLESGSNGSKWIKDRVTDGMDAWEDYFSDYDCRLFPATYTGTSVDYRSYCSLDGVIRIKR